jgi:translation elongation factor EF-Ts
VWYFIPQITAKCYKSPQSAIKYHKSPQSAIKYAIMLTTAELNTQLKINKQKLKNIKLMDTIKTYHAEYARVQASLEDSKAALSAANMALADAANKPECISYKSIIDDWRRNEFGIQTHQTYVAKKSNIRTHDTPPNLVCELEQLSTRVPTGVNTAAYMGFIDGIDVNDHILNRGP